MRTLKLAPQGKWHRIAVLRPGGEYVLRCGRTTTLPARVSDGWGFDCGECIADYQAEVRRAAAELRPPRMPDGMAVTCGEWDEGGAA